MSTRIKSLTEGSPTKLIIAFALPLMLGNVFQQLYTVVDTMVVGKGVGVHALAAVGAVDWLNWMMLGIIQGLTQGFGIPMAQEFGAKDYAGLRRTVGCAVILSAIGALLLLVVGQGVAYPVVLLLQTPEEIIPDALLYLRIMFAGIPIVMLYNLLACILRALGDSRTPLHAMVVACFTNIALDLLFVLLFRWGIAGAAIATLIAQGISSIFCFWRLRKVEILKLDRTHFRLEGRRALGILRLGAPGAFMNMIIAIGGMVVQSVINTYGVAFMAGIVATNKLYGILEIAALSYGFAMTTYVGQNLGAKKLDRIKKGVASALIVAVVTSLVIGTVMILLGRSIVSLFISGDAGDVARSVDVGYRYLCLMSVCLPVLYILYVTRASLQGLGNAMLPMISGIMEFVVRVAAAFLLPAVLGEHGIYFAEVLAWLGADLILIPSYLVTIRKTEKEQVRT